MGVERALDGLRHLPYEDIKHAVIDHHRTMRQGIPEVVLAKDKRAEDVSSIAKAMLEKSGRFLITKADRTMYEFLKKDGLSAKGMRFYPLSGVIALGGERAKKGKVAVLTAGTSDIPVAEEASVTASFLGSRVVEIFDVGVAGLHRLIGKRKLMSGAKVLVVVAGMEGALPSVVGGMTDRPVIAVPSSSGYGTSMGGLTALLAMLNSCVPGIAVMNIDNGFGAGCLAHKINTG